jgi:hypothetical protein
MASSAWAIHCRRRFCSFLLRPPLPASASEPAPGAVAVLAGDAVPRRRQRRRLRAPHPVLHPLGPAAVEQRHHAGGQPVRIQRREHEQLVHDLVEETTVVRDHDQRAVVVPQGGFQRFAAAHIEVVRGLVQQQRVVPFLDQAQQGQPPALAARKLPHRPVVQVLAVAERGQEAAQLAQRRGGIHRADLGDHRVVVRDARQLLVIIAKVDVVPHHHAALVRHLLARQQLEQRRLAAPVGPDDAQAIALRHVQVEPPHQHAPAEALAQPARLQHRAAALALRLQREAEQPRLGRGALEPHLALQQLAPALGLLRVLALHIAADVVLGLLDLRLLPLPGRLVLLPAQQALLVEERVVAAVTDNTAAIEVQRARGGAVQEPAVVRDDDRGPAALREEVLQPFAGLEVEMVGGLVQQQQVGTAQQHGRQRCTPPFPAAEPLGRQLPGRARQAHAAERRLESRLHRVAAPPIELLLQPTLLADVLVLRRLVVRRRQARRDVGQLALELPLAGKRGIGHRVDHAPGPAVRAHLQRGLLPEVLQLRAADQRPRAALQRDFAGQDVQQGGLAGAVGAHQGAFLARIHGEGSAPEDALSSEIKMRVSDRQHGRPKVVGVVVVQFRWGRWTVLVASLLRISPAPHRNWTTTSRPWVGNVTYGDTYFGGLERGCPVASWRSGAPGPASWRVPGARTGS